MVFYIFCPIHWGWPSLSHGLMVNLQIKTKHLMTNFLCLCWARCVGRDIRNYIHYQAAGRHHLTQLWYYELLCIWIIPTLPRTITTELLLEYFSPLDRSRNAATFSFVSRQHLEKTEKLKLGFGELWLINWIDKHSVRFRCIGFW